MANSSPNQPIRSISLPSRPHPLVPQIEEHLCRLRSSNDEISTTLSRTSSLSHKLSNLKELYDCLDDLLLLPQNQQKLMHVSNANLVDELIDGSLKLLDACGNVKDVVSQVKERTQEIQSSLRRRSNGELSIGEEVARYVSTRKKSKKITKKCLKDVKVMVKRFGSQGQQKDGNFAIVEALRKIEGVTAEIFETLLEVISGSSKAQFHKRNASLSSMIMCTLMMHQNLEVDEKEVVVLVNEFEDVDSSLSSLIPAQKKRICIDARQADNLRIQMVKLDSSLQDLEEVLESLFRCLVRSRATLLNIFSH